LPPRHRGKISRSLLPRRGMSVDVEALNVSATLSRGAVAEPTLNLTLGEDGCKGGCEVVDPR
jgi:hypothetical protein